MCDRQLVSAFNMSISLLRQGHCGQQTNLDRLSRGHNAAYPGSLGRLRIHSSLHLKPLSALVYNRRKEKAMGRSHNLQETDQQYVTDRQKKDDDPGLRFYSRA